MFFQGENGGDGGEGVGEVGCESAGGGFGAGGVDFEGLLGGVCPWWRRGGRGFYSF